MKSSRPKPVAVGAIRARVVRGPDSGGRWYWRIWRSEHGRTLHLGTGWYSSAELARVLAGMVVTGSDRVAGVVREVLEYFAGYEDGRLEEGTLSPRTVSLHRACLRHLVAVLGAVPVDELRRPVLERYRDLRLQSAAAITVRLELQILRQAWRWARDMELVRHDLIRIPVRERGIQRQKSRGTPTRAHIRAVLGQLDGWARLAVVLYATTGCRLDEIAALTWGQVDLLNARVTVRGKTGERELPLIADAVDALAAAGPGAPEARVLSCAYGTARRLDERLRVACKAAGVPYFPPGGLRRFVYNALVRQAIAAPIRHALLGHGEGVAEHYEHSEFAEQARALQLTGAGLVAGSAEVVELPVSQLTSQAPARQKKQA